MQSTKYDIYKTIKTLLDQGAEVLFTGTPCEASGLRQYLRREYAGLTTCDLICGCVSSPKVYLRYIEYLSEKYDGTVIAVNFKDKREGWRAKSIAIAFDNGKEYYNSILDDDYVVSFTVGTIFVRLAFTANTVVCAESPTLRSAISGLSRNTIRFLTTIRGPRGS